MSEEREVLMPHEAVRAMLNGEMLYDSHNDLYVWESPAFIKKCDHIKRKEISDFRYLSRQRVRETRLMTPWECIAWVNSEESRGWFVQDKTTWVCPQAINYHYANINTLRRARLLPDLSGIDESTICRFEVKDV